MMEDNTILYNDKFCKLTPTRLTLKTYYPIGTSKRIPLQNIKNVEVLTYIAQPKLFGLSPSYSNIWFACDFSRQSKTQGIVITTRSSIKKGFSCENINNFMNILQMTLKDQISLE